MESHFPQMEQHASRHARELVVDDVHRLIDDAEMLLKATAHDVSDKVQQARQRVIDAVNEAKASCAALTHKADSKVRQHPYTAISVALAAGFAIGYLYDNRRRPA
jgi:ElaB/YqjD/DUF883 family membrane-anchored ribosome-binding protein